MQSDLNAFLKTDRQWRRHERIGHALLQLKQAKTPADRSFWNAVLAANGHRVRNNKRRKVAA